MKKIIPHAIFSALIFSSSLSTAQTIRQEQFDIGSGKIEISTPIDAMDLVNYKTVATVSFNGKVIYSVENFIIYAEHKNIEQRFFVIEEGDGGNWCPVSSYRVIKITNKGEAKVSKAIQDGNECYGGLIEAKKNQEGKIILKFEGESGNKKIIASFE